VKFFNYTSPQRFRGNPPKLQGVFPLLGQVIKCTLPHILNKLRVWAERARAIANNFDLAELAANGHYNLAQSVNNELEDTFVFINLYEAIGFLILAGLLINLQQLFGLA
jgi:hypothetical protein